MTKFATPYLAKVSHATPKLSEVQLKSIELTCHYYGWEYNYSVSSKGRKLTLKIENALYNVVLIGHELFGIDNRTKEKFNLSRTIKKSKAFAEAGIFKIPKEINKQSFKEMVQETMANLAGASPLFREVEYGLKQA